MVRPFHTFDHPQYPTSMDTVVKLLGAEPIDWPLKTRCCGGSLTGTITDVGQSLVALLLKEARARGAEEALAPGPEAFPAPQVHTERQSKSESSEGREGGEFFGSREVATRAHGKFTALTLDSAGGDFRVFSTNRALVVGGG